MQKVQACHLVFVTALAVTGCAAERSASVATISTSTASGSPSKPYRLCGFGQGPAPTDLPAICKGSSVAFASALAWLDHSHFGFGRWDGEFEIYRYGQSEKFGPVLTSATIAPAKVPVTAIASVSPTAFVTSNDAGSLAYWSLRSNGVAVVRDTFSYDKSAGAAVSATVVRWGSKTLLAVGHENGMVTVWQSDRQRLKLLATIDATSPDPINSPIKVKHIRGIVPGPDGTIITGSEDGDLAMIDIASRRVVFRTRYNPAAQRGINALAIDGNVLAVVNCAVGSNDRNLWLFNVAARSLTPAASVNLALDTTRAQVFAFHVALVRSAGSLKAFVTTEENLLWSAEISPELDFGQLRRAALDPDAASAMALSPDHALLAAGAYNPHILSPQ